MKVICMYFALYDPFWTINYLLPLRSLLNCEVFAYTLQFAHHTTNELPGKVKQMEEFNMSYPIVIDLAFVLHKFLVTQCILWRHKTQRIFSFYSPTLPAMGITSIISNSLKTVRIMIVKTQIHQNPFPITFISLTSLKSMV